MVALFTTPGWAQLVSVLGIMVVGQVVRYTWIKRIGERGREKRITKREMRDEVTAYFEQHPEVAARFIKMDELRKKGRYHDALMLANALKKENLSPIVNRYVEYKIKQFKQYTRFGVK